MGMSYLSVRRLGVYAGRALFMAILVLFAGSWYGYQFFGGANVLVCVLVLAVLAGVATFIVGVVSCLR